MDHYVVLGIGEDADEEAIRSAFRALARRFHPDVGAGSSALEFQRAREAYETLVDPDRRRRYDRQLETSRARSVAVRVPSERLRARPEPLAPPRHPSSGATGRWAAVMGPSLFEELLEELLLSFDDHWF